MKVDKIKWNNIILHVELFVLGILSFSLINRLFWSGICGLPFTLPEVFWISFFLINIKRYSKDIALIRNKKFILSCCFIIIMILYSWIRGGAPVSIISYMQSVFEMIVFIILFMDYENVDVNKIWWLCFGCVCGDTFYLMSVSGEIFETVNHIAWVGCCISSLLVKSKYKIILSYILCFVGAVFSGYRINIILVLVALMTCLLWKLLRKRKNTVKSIFGRIGLSVTLVAGTVFVYNNLINIIQKIANVFNFEAYKVYRVVTRLQIFLSGNSTGTTDSVRIEFMRKAITEFDNHILPTGLIYETLLGKTGYYIDCPILFFYEIFGSVTTWIILIFLAFWSVRLIISSLTDMNISGEYLFAALSVPCFVLLIILNGFFVVSNYSAVISGIIIGVILKYAVSVRKKIT